MTETQNGGEAEVFALALHEGYTWEYLENNYDDHTTYSTQVFAIPFEVIYVNYEK